MSKFSLGDHLFTESSVYSHHGIYSGNGKVIHYMGWEDKILKKEPIVETSLEDFHLGNSCIVIHHKDSKYSRKEIVDRAYSKIGENKYNLAFNNCEHLVNWCITGKKKSDQTKGVTAVGGLAGTGGGTATAIAITSKAAAEIAAAEALAVSSMVPGGAGAVMSTGFPAGVAATSTNISTVAGWLTPVWATFVAANPVVIVGGCVVVGGVAGCLIANKAYKHFRKA